MASRSTRTTEGGRAHPVAARAAEGGCGTSQFEALVLDVRGCFACERMTHSHVLGAANGPLDADVLFVAEAVGRRGGAVTGVPLTRDETGRRFGDFLGIAGIDRSRVFITNAALCNPVDGGGRNRRPMASEIGRCRPFLARTLEIVRAPVVVALGRVALDSLGAIAPHKARLGEGVGCGVAWHIGASGRPLNTLVPMYHPSRQSTLHRPQAAQEDDWRRLGALVRRVCGANVCARSTDVYHWRR